MTTTNTNDKSTEEKAGVEGIFDRAAPTYDRVGPRFFGYFGQRLVELAAIKTGSTVLDVAAGRGAILFPMAEKVGQAGSVTGIDFSGEMVRQTAAEINERGLKNTQMLQMDAEHLDFEAASFDYVTCGFALFFFPNPAHALTEFKRVLKPGGLLAISTWGKADPLWQWTSALFQRPHSQNSKSRPSFDTPADLQNDLQQAGFADIRVEVEEADFPYQGVEDWWATQWSHGMRAMWEKMPPAMLEAKKDAAFTQLNQMQTPAGIHQVWQALFTFASKP